MHRILNAVFVLGLGQGIVVLCGIVTVKIFAVVAGPAAVGAFSLVRGLVQTVTTVGSFGGPNWVIQGVAVRAGTPDQREFARAAWWFAMVAAVAVFLVGVVLGPEGYFFDRGDLREVFSPSTMSWVAFAIAFGILLNFYRSLLLAHLRTGKVSRVNAYAGLTSLLLAYPVAKAVGAGQFAWAAALLALSLAAGLFAGVLYSRSLGFGKLAPRAVHVPGARMVAAVLQIALPTLAIFAVGSITIFLLRVLVTRQFGIAAAGIFDAAWTLSTVGLGLLLTTVSNYLLPATGVESSHMERAELFESALRLVTLVAVPIIVVAICGKTFLLRLFYASDFVGAASILRWMLVGEYLKSAGWLLATVAYARGHILAYGIVETLWSVTILAASLFLSDRAGSIEAFGMAYVVGYAIYAVAWATYAKSRGFLSLSLSTAALWGAGLTLILGASAVTWEGPLAGLPANLAVAAITLVFCAGAARKSERNALFLLLKRVWNRAL